MVKTTFLYRSAIAYFLYADIGVAAAVEEFACATKDAAAGVGFWVHGVSIDDRPVKSTRCLEVFAKGVLAAALRETRYWRGIIYLSRSRMPHL